MTEELIEKWGFIVNPIAGNGIAKNEVPKLKQEIEKNNINAQIVYTEKAGHAFDLAEKFIKEKFTHIIAVGGDGTFNEIVRALVNVPNIIAGIIPCGTGNDFNYILGFPDRYKQKDWDIFFKVDTKKIDIGVCNGKVFTNGMGLGFDAKVAEENYIEPGKVKSGGKIKYLWHIIKTIIFYKEKIMINKLNNNNNELCFINTISIGRRFAGDFMLTPEAFADDGMLDVCFIEKVSIFERFKILSLVSKGKHLSHSKVRYYKIDKLKLSFEEKVPYHLDGELFFANYFDVSIMSKKLSVIYNSLGNHLFV